MTRNIIDFKSARSIKELVLTANDTIGALENALYKILDCDRLDVVKEIAAEALGEDLDIYLEDDNLAELDFEEDLNINWDDINSEDDK